MSTLIIGALFAVALVTIVGIVFLLRGESQTPKQGVTRVDNEPLKLSETSAIAQGGTPTQPGLPAPTTENENEAIPEYGEAEQFPVGNGQFHRLSVELHSLHGQAQEIENRLSVLTEIAERIENNQNFTSIEDDVTETAPAN
jgi:hypothetical protein